MMLAMTPARRGFVLGLLLTAAFMLVAACATTSPANQVQTDFTDRQESVYERGQPLHQYDYSQDRASYQAIYDARVQGKATYQVSVPVMGGTPWYQCPARGYPIPATTQLTNPERIDYSRGGTPFVLPQAEPNGTFPGPTDGTYMQCVDTDGSLYSVYSEPPVLAFPFAVRWDSQQGFVKANPNDKASYSLPTAGAGQNNTPVAITVPSATATR